MRRQAGERIVQRQMPQLVLAGRDARRGMAHVAQGESGEEGKPAERNENDRDAALDDFGRTTFRRPGKVRSRLARSVA